MTVPPEHPEQQHGAHGTRQRAEEIHRCGHHGCLLVRHGRLSRFRPRQAPARLPRAPSGRRERSTRRPDSVPASPPFPRFPKTSAYTATARRVEPQPRAPAVARIAFSLEKSSRHQPLQDPGDRAGVQPDDVRKFSRGQAGKRPTTRSTSRWGPVMPSSLSIRLDIR